MEVFELYPYIRQKHMVDAITMCVYTNSEYFINYRSKKPKERVYYRKNMKIYGKEILFVVDIDAIENGCIQIHSDIDTFMGEVFITNIFDSSRDIIKTVEADDIINAINIVEERERGRLVNG